jgi:hypothetical protein
MKKLLYLGIVLMLASCGSDEVVTDPSNESESAVSNESESATSTLNVSGREVSTIKIGKKYNSSFEGNLQLEVTTEDLGPKKRRMNWEDAKKLCADIGEGWRLPSKEELYFLYENKDEIGGFGDANYRRSATDLSYWSSTSGKTNPGFYAWSISFKRGKERLFPKVQKKYVRAVRSIE